MCINTGIFYQTPLSMYLLACPNKPGLLQRTSVQMMPRSPQTWDVRALPSVVLFDDGHVITLSHG